MQLPLHIQDMEKHVNHKIIEWTALEVTFKAHLVQLAQVAWSPIQPDAECFQEWGINHLSWQPVPVFTSLGVKNFCVLVLDFT